MSLFRGTDKNAGGGDQRSKEADFWGYAGPAGNRQTATCHTKHSGLHQTESVFQVLFENCSSHALISGDKPRQSGTLSEVIANETL